MRRQALLPIAAVLPTALLGLLTACTGPRIHARGLEEVRRGYDHLDRGDLERAEVAFAHALAYHQDFPEALNGAGVVARQRGDHREARRRFEQALRAAPDFAEALVNLGELDLAEGRTGRAEASFRAALKVDPDLVPARLDLARTLLHRGRAEPAERDRLWSAARREYLHLLESKPDCADAHHDLAFMDYEAGRFERAAASYEAALAAGPDRLDALHGRCVALAQQGRCVEALPSCRRCVELAPGQVTCERSLAAATACAGMAQRSP
jgi:tetratricopeptide (TPR) repeat protein